MSKTVIDTAALMFGAMDLRTFIDNQYRVPLSTVYVRDQNGNPITRASLEEETLTDGSKVYNLILTVKGED